MTEPTGEQEYQIDYSNRFLWLQSSQKQLRLPIVHSRQQLGRPGTDCAELDWTGLELGLTQPQLNSTPLDDSYAAKVKWVEPGPGIRRPSKLRGDLPIIFFPFLLRDLGLPTPYPPLIRFCREPYPFAQYTHGGIPTRYPPLRLDAISLQTPMHRPPCPAPPFLLP